MTVPAVTVNVADVAPAATVTLAGTLAADDFELESETTAPPDGAADVRVTVPVTEFPLVTELELSVIPLRAATIGAGLTVIGDVAVTELYVALRVTEVALLTVPAVIVNVADVAPAATVTLAGTFAAVEFELESVTTAPPEGAAAVSVTVPVTELPLVTELEASVKPLRAAGTGLTVIGDVAVTELYVALRVTEVALLTVPAVTVNVADVAPAVTVTLAGTLAAVEFELERVTTTPPEGAAEVRVTIPVTEFPLVTELELSVTPLRAAGAGLTVVG
ncbi:MAG TPA: hypothetical protein VMG40_18550 [Bryobacteraceae bacterium]|nr:hypothetical protein [Bryobacteraceae bacterium]